MTVAHEKIRNLLIDIDSTLRSAEVSDGQVPTNLLRSLIAQHDPLAAVSSIEVPVPAARIDMIIYCPACGLQHIDEPESDEAYASRLTTGGIDPQWTNPDHRSHLCRKEDGGCGFIFRPADVCTNGIAKVKTRGSADSPHRPSAKIAETTWKSCAEGEFPGVGVEVIAGYWYVDAWLKGKPWVWRQGIASMITDDDRDYAYCGGKRWLTFGPAHSAIAYWTEAPKAPPAPATAAAKEVAHAR